MDWKRRFLLSDPLKITQHLIFVDIKCLHTVMKSIECGVWRSVIEGVVLY
jgi:hypothetical protein